MKTKLSNFEMPVFIIGMCLFLVAACLGWIKLKYGFNFTDEGYHATESWRLAVGDHFLDDKITGALRHYTLFNSFVFKIHPAISLLQLRQIQFILTIISLLIFSIALFQQTRHYASLPFVFSLFAFTGLDPVGLISNLSYQTYPHLFLVLYLSFMLFGFQSENHAIKKIAYLLSGLSLWLMSLTLLHLGIIVLAPIIVFILCHKFKLKEYTFTFRELLCVLLPFGVCWLLFITIFNKAYLLNLFNSFNIIVSVSTYSEKLINFNWEQIKRITISMAYLSLFFVSVKKLPVQFYTAGCALLSLFILLMINTPLFNFLVPYYGGWFARPMWFSSMLIAFTLLFWTNTIRKYVVNRIFTNIDGLSIILMVPFSICAFTVNIFSGLGPMAVCQVSIPAVITIFYFFTSELKGLKYRHPVTIFILLLLLGPFYYTTARHDWNFTFYDVPPKQASVRIENGFGKGIYTNPIYAKLHDWLIANATYFTQPGDYAISYIMSPMVHMITKLRPSLDDTFMPFIVDQSMVDQNYYKKCIEKMEQRERNPKIAFIFERVPVILGGPEMFPDKQFDFPSSRDPISIYIKNHMTSVSTFKISDDHIIRCYVDFNLAKDRKTGNTP